MLVRKLTDITTINSFFHQMLNALLLFNRLVIFCLGTDVARHHEAWALNELKHI